MTLSVSIQHRFGSFALDAAFESPGGLTALFGPSGAGKTSLVRAIAGLVRPEQGRIAVGDSALVDTATKKFIPAHRRGIGYVFQEPRLLPHLSVKHNLLYGRWFTRSRGAAADFDRIVQLLDIGALLHRTPGALSGGEAQRVAIGRALLSKPRLLLMDEPLASIDEMRKAEILPYVERLRDELQIPIVYVSHVLDEIVRLATTLVVMDRGRVVVAGALTDVLSRVDVPILARRADAGVVLDARIAAHDEHWYLTQLDCAAGVMRVPKIDLPLGTPLRIWVRARDVSLATDYPQGISVLNILLAHVVEVAAGDGASVDVRLECNGAPLLARVTKLSSEGLGLQPGRSIYALVKSVAFERI
jgi:molybdate transport system ATP-binding protein